MNSTNNHDLEVLIRVTLAASDGAEPTEDELRAIRWRTSDDVINQAASDAWNRLKNFVTDVDIRTRDKEYDSQMRSELKWRAEELRQLAAGGDPYGRRVRPISRIRGWLSSIFR